MKSLTKSSLTIKLGLFLIIVLPNHDIFNFLFQGTPLVVWKQLMGILLIILSFVCIESTRINDRGLSRIRLLQRLLFIIILILAIASFFNGLSLMRISYGAIAYLGFAGALGFSHLCLIKNKFFQTLNLFFYVGLFCSIGITMDYFFPILDFLPRASDAGLEDQILFGYLRRASFLFGASTIVYPFLSFSIVAISIILSQDKTNKNIIKFFLLTFLSILAIYLTGSRSNLILILVFLTLIFLFTFSFLSLQKKIIFVAPLIALPLFFDLLFGFVYQSESLTDRYLDAFSPDAAGNDNRFIVWQKGLDLFNNFGANFIVGNGIGSTLGMINDGFPYTGHYESSFFQSFSEGGIFGIILRYLPFFFAAVTLLLKNYAWSPIEKIIFLWLVTYVFSVSVSPTAGAYHTQFVYFFACGIALQMSLVNKVTKSTIQPTKIHS